jgi:dipeptidyl aminopeptidase/acylaminoacyl peptidase
VGLSGVYDVQAEYDYWQAQGVYPEVLVDVMGGEERLAAASPIRYVRPDLPPILLIHGDEDETVPVAIATAFYAALQEAGVPSTLTIYAGSGHTDFLFAALTEERAPLITDLADFVR